MLKLYKVTVEHEIFVLANNVKEAQSTAEYHVQNELSIDTCATEVNKSTQINKDWLNSLPYGPHDAGDLQDKTVKEIIDTME